MKLIMEGWRKYLAEETLVTEADSKDSVPGGAPPPKLYSGPLYDGDAPNLIHPDPDMAKLTSDLFSTDRGTRDLARTQLSQDSQRFRLGRAMGNPSGAVNAMQIPYELRWLPKKAKQYFLDLPRRRADYGVYTNQDGLSHYVAYKKAYYSNMLIEYFHEWLEMPKPFATIHPITKELEGRLGGEKFESHPKIRKSELRWRWRAVWSEGGGVSALGDDLHPSQFRVLMDDARANFKMYLRHRFATGVATPGYTAVNAAHHREGGKNPRWNLGYTRKQKSAALAAKKMADKQWHKERQVKLRAPMSTGQLSLADPGPQQGTLQLADASPEEARKALQDAINDADEAVAKSKKFRGKIQKGFWLDRFAHRLGVLGFAVDVLQFGKIHVCEGNIDCIGRVVGIPEPVDTPLSPSVLRQIELGSDDDEKYWDCSHCEDIPKGQIPKGGCDCKPTQALKDLRAAVKKKKIQRAGGSGGNTYLKEEQFNI